MKYTAIISSKECRITEDGYQFRHLFVLQSESLAELMNLIQPEEWQFCHGAIWRDDDDLASWTLEREINEDSNAPTGNLIAVETDMNYQLELACDLRRDYNELVKRGLREHIEEIAIEI